MPAIDAAIGTADLGGGVTATATDAPALGSTDSQLTEPRPSR